MNYDDIVVVHIEDYYYSFTQKRVMKTSDVYRKLFTWEEFTILCNDLGAATECDRRALAEYRKIIFKSELEEVLK